jgi:hypothetical protein
MLTTFSGVEFSTSPSLSKLDSMASPAWWENPTPAAATSTYEEKFNSSFSGQGQGQTTVFTAVPSPVQNIIMLSFNMTWVYVAVSIVGVISNIFVILVIISSSLLRSQPRNWFIFCQSVADCLSAIYIGTLPTKNSTTPLYVS